MKKLLRFAILIFFAIAALFTAASCSCNNKKANYTQGLKYLLDERTGGYMVEDIGSAYAEHLIIPSEIKGVPVTAIGASAFEYCDFITQITLPDSVISIGNYAFYGTGYYNDANNWENGTLYIGNHLIEVDRYKTGNYEIHTGTVTVADGAFYRCQNIASVTIPEGVKALGSYSFFRCEKIASLDIPQSVIRIGSYAFENCFALENIVIPDGVTYFGDGVFWDCTNLERCVLGGGITEIGEDTFKNCGSLMEVIISESVTSIVRNAFYNCTSLESVTIPQAVVHIGSNAFYGCTALTEAVFAVKSGWMVSRTQGFEDGREISSQELSDPLTAATYIKSNYNGYYWKRV